MRVFELAKKGTKRRSAEWSQCARERFESAGGSGMPTGAKEPQGAAVEAQSLPTCAAPKHYIIHSLNVFYTEIRKRGGFYDML